MIELIKNISKNIGIISLIISLFLLNSCGIAKYKRSDVKNNPVNDAEKRAKNAEEGKGFSILGSGKKSGTFQFGTSNEMWRAAINILDFVPLSSADYGGGIIISDWYTDGESSLEAFKITVVFLSDEIRADGLNVKIHKKICSDNYTCKVVEQKSNLNTEIKMAILKRAAQIKRGDRKKTNDEDRTYKKEINTDRVK